MIKYEAIGVIEIQYFTFASEVLDSVCKGANVEFLSAEKYLGGRLVSLIVGGSVSDIKAAIEIAKEACQDKPGNPLKMALAITNPHEEIMKYIVPFKQEAPFAGEQDADVNRSNPGDEQSELAAGSGSANEMAYSEEEEKDVEIDVNEVVIEPEADESNVDDIIEQIKDRPEFNDPEEEK